MKDIRTFQYFTGNQWHDPIEGQYIESENPATGEIWARILIVARLM